MRGELVIFDCDGVLVDSEPLANEALAETFQAFGFDISVQTCIDEMKGHTLPYCFDLAERWCGKPVPEAFHAALQSATFARFRAALEPVPGVRGLIERLQAAGAETCVASSGEHDKMAVSLGVTGLKPLFEGRIYSRTDVARGKPAPDLFLHAARQFDRPPERCLVIEDSPPGAQAARAAGMRCFGYVGGSLSSSLAEHGAIEFDDMTALGDRLLGSA